MSAGLVLGVLGHTMNAIAFAGLAGALGVVVDDAVSGVEAVVRRARDADPPVTAATVLEASHDARRPIAFATLIGLLAAVPVAVMAGRPGAFFEPLALSYALAVATSTAVAVTVTPALTLVLLRGAPPEGSQSPILRWTGPRYARALAPVVRAPRTTFVLAAVACVAGLAALSLLTISPVPVFRDPGVLVRLAGAPGTSHPAINERWLDEPRGAVAPWSRERRRTRRARGDGRPARRRELERAGSAWTPTATTTRPWPRSRTS